MVSCRKDRLRLVNDDVVAPIVLSASIFSASVLFCPVGIAVTLDTYVNGKDGHELGSIHDNGPLQNFTWNDDSLFQRYVEHVAIVKERHLLLRSASSHFNSIYFNFLLKFFIS